jgi:thioredoxin reductase
MDHSVSFGGNPDHEYLILGAGPAGLQIGQHLARAGHSYLILEAGDSPGTFFKKFPRHRTLISSNKVFTGFEDPEVNLRFDWNSLLDDGDGRLRFKDYCHQYFPPADDLARYLSDYARYFGLDLRCNTRILRIEKPAADRFRLIDTEGNVFSCRRLIVATGVSRSYVPQIPGIELAENYVDVSIDPEDFTDQRVLILGKGNSAFETAENLTATAALVNIASPYPLRSSWKTPAVGHLLDCTVERIGRRDGFYVVEIRYNHANGGAEELIYDRVIVCTGFRFDDSIFAAECRPKLVIDDRFPAQTCEWESVNVPGLYFAGTLMQANDFQRATSGFIQGFRYNVRALHRMLERQHHGRDWPARSIEPTPEGLLEATLARVNRSSALWQQCGFLHDAIVVEEGWDRATYYEEMPLAYLHASEIGARSHYYTVTLERAGEAEKSSSLHPVIRRWCGRQRVSEHHVLEDLFGEWRKPEAHVAPLRYFFMAQLLESVDFEKVELTRTQGLERPVAARPISQAL